MKNPLDTDSEASIGEEEEFGWGVYRQETFSSFDKFRSASMTKHNFLLHILLISCSNRNKYKLYFFIWYIFLITFLHESHILGTYHVKSDQFGRLNIPLLCQLKIIYVGFTGSYQANYDMLPNLNQYMGGKPYLVSLEPNIMHFWCQFQPYPWNLYIWNFSSNQSKDPQLSSIWFNKISSQIPSLDWHCMEYYHLIYFCLYIYIWRIP